MKNRHDCLKDMSLISLLCFLMCLSLLAANSPKPYRKEMLEALGITTAILEPAVFAAHTPTLAVAWY